LLIGRRHFPGHDLAQQRGVIGLAGDDFVTGDELVTIQDIIEAAFNGTILSVAMVAVGLEHLACLGGDSRRRIGRSSVRGAKRDEESVCESGALHVDPLGWARRALSEIIP